MYFFGKIRETASDTGAYYPTVQGLELPPAVLRKKTHANITKKTNRIKGHLKRSTATPTTTGETTTEALKNTGGYLKQI